jgi:ceramide glucosyltransferase
VNLCAVTLAHLSVAVSAVSLALYAAMIALFARAMAAWRARERPELDRAPRVTIFKPLAGCDDDLEDNLESFAQIDYPSFEILLGVADPSDPAFAAARAFVARHPELDLRIVITDPDAATNPKVAQLVGLERVATGEVYVISDSNIRVPSWYLWSIVAEFTEAAVGMVTSVFAGTGERTLGAALENLQICASSMPGLVAMNMVSHRTLTVGKSMAVRRRDLARLGGFLPVGGVLAEDYVLGRRFLDAGFLARTSLDVVENRNVACSVGRTVDRHTRWAKMRRSLFPSGFAMEPILTPIVVASLGWVVSPSKTTAMALVAICVLQTACALFAVKLVRGHHLAWWYAPLEIARSYVTLVCWLRAWGSRRISWRGHPFELGRGSAIDAVASQAERPAGRSRQLA